MNLRNVSMVAIVLVASSGWCAEQPANSDLALDDSFNRDELGKNWRVNTGAWEIVNGVLRGREIASQKHSAAARRILETQNAVYDLKFRFVDAGKAFHLGFDPKRGELTKQGHLFSLIVTPTSWTLRKHKDKKRPDVDTDETIAQEPAKFESGKWYSLRVTTWEQYVTARVEGVGTLKGSHSSFAIKKPALVFRCLGDGVEIDDIMVFTQKQQ